MALEKRRPVTFPTLEAYEGGVPPGSWEWIDHVLYRQGLPVYREELEAAWKGENVVPAPTGKHQRAAKRIVRYLDAYLEEHQLGEVMIAPRDVLLAPEQVVQPEVIYVANSGKARVTEQRVEGPPDLVVEVISPSSKLHDTQVKKGLYEAHGVLEYWLVWPEEERVEVFVREGKRFAMPVLLQVGDVLVTGLLPGFGLAVERLFARY